PPGRRARARAGDPAARRLRRGSGQPPAPPRAPGLGGAPRRGSAARAARLVGRQRCHDRPRGSPPPTPRPGRRSVPGRGGEPDSAVEKSSQALFFPGKAPGNALESGRPVERTALTTIVAEKPSVARYLAKVLGATERGEGFLRGNGYLVTWA